MRVMHQHAELIEEDFSAEERAPLPSTGSAGASRTCTAGLMRVSSSSLIMATICKTQKAAQGLRCIRLPLL